MRCTRLVFVLSALLGEVELVIYLINALIFGFKFGTRKEISPFSLSTVFRTLASKDFRPANFFDVASAFKVFDYLVCGNSIFKATTPTPKEMAQKLGIFTHSHLERFLYVYFHARNFLPAELIKFLDAKSRIELDLSSNVFVAEAKEARKQLRLKYETHAVHVVAKPVIHLTVPREKS